MHLGHGRTIVGALFLGTAIVQPASKEYGDFNMLVLGCIDPKPRTWAIVGALFLDTAIVQPASKEYGDFNLLVFGAGPTNNLPCFLLTGKPKEMDKSSVGERFFGFFGNLKEPEHW